jgi:hypothetical protein
MKYATTLKEFMEEDILLAPYKKGDVLDATTEDYCVLVTNQKGELVDVFNAIDLENLAVECVERRGAE